MRNNKKNIIAASIFTLGSILATPLQAAQTPTGALLFHSAVAQTLFAGLEPLRLNSLMASLAQRAREVQDGGFAALSASASPGLSADREPGISDGVMTGAITGKRPSPATSGNADSSDVFNSVAIPFRKLGALKKAAPTFREIASGSALRCKSGDCQGFTQISLSKADNSIRAILDAVNAEVNARIRYRRDIDTHGRMDQWSSPSETLSRGTGDCEDYALLKMAVLAERGVPLNDMTVVILYDTKRKFYHAVLSVEVRGNHYILDNMRNQVLADRQLPDYQPLFSISDSRGFLHGTKVKGKALALKSLDNVAPGEGGEL